MDHEDFDRAMQDWAMVRDLSVSPGFAWFWSILEDQRVKYERDALGPGSENRDYRAGMAAGIARVQSVYEAKAKKIADRAGEVQDESL